MSDREREPLLDAGTEATHSSGSPAGESYGRAKLVTDSSAMRPGIRRRVRVGRGVLEQEEEDAEQPRRSFCRSWCEMWFHVARSRVSCSICTAILWIFGLALILVTAFSGLKECPSLTGATVFCYLFGCLALSLGLVCCCYHWVRDDEDLPHAMFCVAYCLLLLFIFTSVAGTTSVLTHYDILSNGTQDDGLGNKTLSCGMTYLPVGVMVLSMALGVFFVIMSYVACILALGATSDIKW